MATASMEAANAPEMHRTTPTDVRARVFRHRIPRPYPGAALQDKADSVGREAERAGRNSHCGRQTGVVCYEAS
jgi:hypothetical protein